MKITLALIVLLGLSSALADPAQDAVQTMDALVHLEQDLDGNTVSSQCEFCEKDSGGPPYTPRQAFADMASEPLLFVGRDYLDPSLPSGGSYTCIYKNSKVYVIHDGCRPTATQALSVFSARIMNRRGGSLDVYLENSRSNYTLHTAGPNHDGSWRLNSYDTAPIGGEPSFRQMASKVIEERADYRMNSCGIGKSSTSSTRSSYSCKDGSYNGADDFEDTFRSPLDHGLAEAHNLIINAPRR